MRAQDSEYMIYCDIVIQHVHNAELMRPEGCQMYTCYTSSTMLTSCMRAMLAHDHRERSYVTEQGV